MVRKRRTLEEFKDFFTAYAENFKEEKRVEEEKRKEEEKQQLFREFTAVLLEEEKQMQEEKEEDVDGKRRYKCTVHGPCFDKEFGVKQSLKVHMEMIHGDPMEAAKRRNSKTRCKLSVGKSRRTRVERMRMASRWISEEVSCSVECVSIHCV
jgi:hypothetical protein